ncbi:MAG: hypothetical protein ABIO99_02430 [Candidatus Limnocylindria bacterium]
MAIPSAVFDGGGGVHGMTLSAQAPEQEAAQANVVLEQQDLHPGDGGTPHVSGMWREAALTLTTRRM